MDDVEKYSRCRYQELALGVYVSFELLIVRLLRWAVYLDSGVDGPDRVYCPAVPMLPVVTSVFELVSLIISVGADFHNSGRYNNDQCIESEHVLGENMT